MPDPLIFEFREDLVSKREAQIIKAFGTMFCAMLNAIPNRGPGDERSTMWNAFEVIMKGNLPDLDVRVRPPSGP